MAILFEKRCTFVVKIIILNHFSSHNKLIIVSLFTDAFVKVRIVSNTSEKVVRLMKDLYKGKKIYNQTLASNFNMFKIAYIWPYIELLMKTACLILHEIQIEFSWEN